VDSSLQALDKFLCFAIVIIIAPRKRNTFVDRAHKRGKFGEQLVFLFV